jgi:hypothetical protein
LGLLLGLPGGLLRLRSWLHTRTTCLTGSGEVTNAVAVFVHELARAVTIGVASARTIALDHATGCTGTLGISRARRVGLTGSSEIAYAVAVLVHEVAHAATIGVASARTIALGHRTGCTGILGISHARRVGLTGSGEIAYAVAVFIYKFAHAATIGVGSARTIALGHATGSTSALSIPHAWRVGLTGSGEIAHAVAVFVHELARATIICVGVAGALTARTAGAIALRSRHANTQQQRGQHHQSDYPKPTYDLAHYQSPNRVSDSPISPTGRLD